MTTLREKLLAMGFTEAQYEEGETIVLVGGVPLLPQPAPEEQKPEKGKPSAGSCISTPSWPDLASDDAPLRCERTARGLTDRRMKVDPPLEGSEHSERVRAGRGRQPQASMDAARVLDLLEHLSTLDIPVWLMGGWGIDALLGTQTRPHDDLDLVARLDDAERIEAAFGEHGYVLAGGGAPLSVELVDPGGHQIDVHPVSFAPTGDGIYKMSNGEDWVYPADGFTGVGRILDREVPCLTPDVMLMCHTTGYALDEDHQRDVTALSERFNLPLPDFRTM